MDTESIATALNEIQNTLSSFVSVFTDGEYRLQPELEISRGFGYTLQIPTNAPVSLSLRINTYDGETINGELLLNSMYVLRRFSWNIHMGQKQV